MTISLDWKSDPREVYEPKLCRLRNVYRTIPARRQYYCDQCHGIIAKGEDYDVMAVAGAGLSGYTHPARFHTGCREEHINKVNQKYAEDWGIFLYFCAWCGRYKEYKDYGGQVGLSHGICDDCSIDETPLWHRGVRERGGNQEIHRGAKG